MPIRTIRTGQPRCARGPRTRPRSRGRCCGPAAGGKRRLSWVNPSTDQGSPDAFSARTGGHSGTVRVFPVEARGGSRAGSSMNPHTPHPDESQDSVQTCHQTDDPHPAVPRRTARPTRRPVRQLIRSRRPDVPAARPAGASPACPGPACRSRRRRHSSPTPAGDPTGRTPRRLLRRRPSQGGTRPRAASPDARQLLRLDPQPGPLPRTRPLGRRRGQRHCPAARRRPPDHPRRPDRPDRLRRLGVLAYGLAWALLPEPDGRIHVQEAAAGGGPPA